MTTRFKDFGSGTDTATSEPISFMIHGEEFHCVPALQGKALLGFVAESQSADPATQAAVIEKFFDKVLLEESLARFTALQDSKDKIVSVETLSEILGWVVEQYTVRPN
jgi:hypothetical protein